MFVCSVEEISSAQDEPPPLPSQPPPNDLRYDADPDTTESVVNDKHNAAGEMFDDDDEDDEELSANLK